ncbi:hypothetical protein SSBR45G_46290 [Bradyrhizobium sp. SSBR45G]|uniref:hypothetical protein n=1 Tax=unclassified Bradyrhizobium TaxID=2631580 RepID=UPI002342BAA3|nr:MULTISPECIES: hypothetical protein [unclassified Bradyrhizobium]GLH79720.1 hypothetical protein SSBR45G_46290 [Bradyrhizobium sp. SSBR45G]GLH87162.1 hypothetical protein SSBR45R_46220 [Bradyrhizobium sp. SSBR45R]
MTQVYRKLEVTFSKAEIEEILRERARKIARQEGVKVDEVRVAHVEGEAVVTLITWPDDVRRDMRRKERRR